MSSRATTSGCRRPGSLRSWARVLTGSTSFRPATSSEASEPGAGNIIGGLAQGITFEPSAAIGNTVQGNLIGTDRTGNAAVPNVNGIVLYAGADGNIIGTDGDGTNDLAEGKIVSGSTMQGILILSASNTVAGNRVGTNAAGTTVLENGLEGILVSTSTAFGNVIGGHLPAQRNLISGNGAQG